jgi:hypothetical protein
VRKAYRVCQMVHTYRKWLVSGFYFPIHCLGGRMACTCLTKQLCVRGINCADMMLQ